TLSGSISDWAEEITRAAEEPVAPPARERKSASGQSASSKASSPKSAAKSVKKALERSTAPGRTARGTSMGGAATARERAAAGLNPVPGLDISLEEAESLTPGSGVTATV